MRAIAYSQPGELHVESRNLKDITDTYPELFAMGAALGSHRAILDGEIVAFDSAWTPQLRGAPAAHARRRLERRRAGWRRTRP